MGIPIFTHNDIEINYIMKGKGKFRNLKMLDLISFEIDWTVA